MSMVARGKCGDSMALLEKANHNREATSAFGGRTFFYFRGTV
jgi:hypothetical protein